MNWLERAQREISEIHQKCPADTAVRKIGGFKNGAPCTANSAERNLTAVLAVPNLEICEKSKGTGDAPAELEERQALAADRVPERYLDGWSRLQGRRPATVPALQWCQAVDGVGQFLDEWGSLAETFAWSPGDLFDVPRSGRQGGLAWFLRGERVRVRLARITQSQQESACSIACEDDAAVAEDRIRSRSRHWEYQHYSRAQAQ